MTDGTLPPGRVVPLRLTQEVSAAIEAVQAAASPTSIEKLEINDVCGHLLRRGLKAWAADWAAKDTFHLDEWRRVVRWFEENLAIDRLSPDDLAELSPEREALEVLLETTASVLDLNEDTVFANGVTREEAVEQLKELEQWKVEVEQAARLIGQLSHN